MPFAIDLVLFEPARHVVHGMPVFTSTDDALLRYMLMNHGEWGDNTTTWHASQSMDGTHVRLLCQLHTDEGPAYRKRLVPHLAHIKHPWEQDDDVHFKLSTFWYARRRATVEPATAGSNHPMSRLKGNWFPCDGAIALDASALPASCHRQIPDLFRMLMLDQPELMERWRARAEYCFLLRLQPPAKNKSPCIEIRETPFRNREASLVDMQWPVSEALMKRMTA